jgi:hypothetical protein
MFLQCGLAQQAHQIVWVANGEQSLDKLDLS